MPDDLRLRGLTGELAALSFGDPIGRPVLALHGWLDNAASFQPLAGHLPDFHLVALDFAGHGHSRHRPPGAPYHFVDHVADVVHGVRSLGWDRFHVLGHSLGANVAVVFSAIYPELVESLVLLDGVGPTSGKSSDAVSRLRKSVSTGLEPHRSRRSGYPDWKTLISARCQASPISRAGAELLVRRNGYEEDGEIRLRTDRRLRQPSAMYLAEDTVMNFIGQVTAPTLAILAEDGIVQSREITHQRIARFPDASKITLPGNHHMHMDAPAEVADAIATFMQTNSH